MKIRILFRNGVIFEIPHHDDTMTDLAAAILEGDQSLIIKNGNEVFGIFRPHEILAVW